MKLKTQLQLMLALLVLLILVQPINVFYYIESPILYGCYLLFTKLGYLAIMLYLYFFIKSQVKAQLSYLPFVIIVISNVYFLITYFYPIAEQINLGAYNADELFRLYILLALPSIIADLILLVLSIQLIRLKSEYKGINYIGYSLLVPVLLLFLSPLTIHTDFEWMNKLFGFIILTPYIVLGIFYYKLLKSLPA